MMKRMAVMMIGMLAMVSTVQLVEAKPTATNIENVANTYDFGTNTGTIYFSNGVSETFDKDYKLLMVNGNLVDGANIITKNDRTLVPIRIVSEWMGAQVGWDEKTRKVSLDKKGTKIEMIIGNPLIKVNGVGKSTDVAPEIYQNRTYVPVRFISENFGADVHYYDNHDDNALGLIKRVPQVVIDDKMNDPAISKEEAIQNAISALKKSYAIVSKNAVLDEATKLNYENSIKNMRLLRTVSRYYILSGYENIYHFVYDKYTGDIYKINFVQTQTILKFELSDESNFWLAG